VKEGEGREGLSLPPPPVAIAIDKGVIVVEGGGGIIPICKVEVGCIDAVVGGGAQAVVVVDRDRRSIAVVGVARDAKSAEYDDGDDDDDDVLVVLVVVVVVVVVA